MYLLQDVHSDYMKVNLLTSKRGVASLAAYEAFDRIIHKIHGYHIMTLRTDMGGEYIFHGLKEYLAKHGTEHQFSVPHKHQNSKPENTFRQIQESMKAMCVGAWAPTSLWGECSQAWCYVRNNVKRVVRANILHTGSEV